MSLLFADSFDHYATSDITYKWTSVGVSFSGNAGITAATVRYGAGAFYSVTAGTASDRRLVKTLPSSASWIVGFAFQTSGFPGSGPFLVLLDSGTFQCDLRINADGTLSVTRNGTAVTDGTSTVALSLNAWYYIEFKVTIANSIGAGTCKVRVNGVDVITVATGQDLQNTANASANQLLIGNSGPSPGTGATWYYDDLYVCDANGSTNNDFLGDVLVESLYPSGAGNSTQFTPSAGSNHQCVDDTSPDEDSTYVESSTVGHKDTYAFGNLTSVPTTIFGLQTVVTARKTDGGIRTMAPVTRSGGTDYDGSTKSLADSYVSDSQIRETDPATATAWSESGVNNAEFGFKIVA